MTKSPWTFRVHARLRIVGVSCMELLSLVLDPPSLGIHTSHPKLFTVRASIAYLGLLAFGIHCPTQITCQALEHSACHGHVEV